jgi:hypothetical protein
MNQDTLLWPKKKRSSNAFFFWLVWGVRTSLHAPRLFPTAHWTSCKPSEQVRHRRGDRRAHRGSNSGLRRNKSHDDRWAQPSRAFKCISNKASRVTFSTPSSEHTPGWCTWGTIPSACLGTPCKPCFFLLFFLFSNRFDVLISKIFF